MSRSPTPFDVRCPACASLLKTPRLGLRYRQVVQCRCGEQVDYTPAPSALPARQTPERKSL